MEVVSNRLRSYAWAEAYREGGLGSSRHTPTVQYHFFQQDFAGVFHAQGHHGQAVAHENHVHTGVIGDVSTGEIVGRDHGDRLILAVEAPQTLDGDLPPRRCGRTAQRRVGARPRLTREYCDRPQSQRLGSGNKTG